jgi:DNA-binding transcriptional LysR family regulator
MELRYLRYFVSVAEHLHFGHAAKSLNMAQPPLSQQIRRLERELGVELFDRTNKRVELTASGHALLDLAREVIGQADRFQGYAKALRDGEAGTLRIGFVASAMNLGLGADLRSFRRQYPSASISAQQMPVADQVAALLDNRIDLAFTMGTLRHEVLEVIDYEEQPLMAVLPVDHPLASLERLQLKSLEDEVFISYRASFDHRIEDFISAACYQAGFTPKLSYHGPQSHTVQHMVSAGFGVSVLPACDSGMVPGGVVFVPLERPSATVKFSVVRCFGTTSPLGSRLIELIL